MAVAAAGSAHRLRATVLAALGVWLALRQVDGVLAYLQSTGRGGYGANDMYAASPSRLPEYVGDLLAVWETTRPVSHVAFAVYTALDLVFIALYTVLLLRLFRRFGPSRDTSDPIDRGLRKAPQVVAVLALADCFEDILRLVMVAFHDASWWLVYGAWVATTVKWLALATVLLLLVIAWRTTGLGAGRGSWTTDSRRALGRLRIPAPLLGSFGLIMMFDPTGQVGDSFRRWLDSPEQFVESAGFTVGGVALLGLATWTTARRSVLADYRIATRPLSPVRWGVAAAALGATAAGADLPNLWGPAIAIGLVGAVELLWLAFGGRVDEDERRANKKNATTRRVRAARAPAPDLEREIRRVARGLSAWPLLALLLGLVAAWTAPPVVLLPLGHDTTRAVVSAVGAVAAFAVLPFFARAVPGWLSGLEARRPSPGRPARPITVFRRTIRLPAGIEYLHVSVWAACLALCAAAVLRPLDFPGLVGPVGMTAVILALFIVLLGEGQRYGDTHPPSAGLTFVGFSRVPVTLLLLIAVTLGSLLDDGSYHSVHVQRGPGLDRDGTPLETEFGAWSRRNCADAGGRDRMIPMVFVAGQGGGIRAAYWTASVMTDLLGAPAGRSSADPACPDATAFGRVFAMGGASGGSVGVTTYAGHANAGGEWFRDVMGDTDFVAVPVSWALLVDLPRSLVGFDGPDRQRRFEQVWEREDETLAQDFFAGHSADAPALMLSGTQVETGCRLNISPLRLTAQTTSTSSGACADLIGRPGSAPDAGLPSSVLRPTAALTSDVLDFLCDDETFDRSTAALTSARFPYVSPSGRLTRCDGGPTTTVVDGGYAENTGGQPVLNLWARLEPLVAAHNADPRAPLIVPVFVDIDNHYSKAAKAGPAKRTQQLLVPPLTAARSDRFDDRGVEQLANAEFSTALPGARDTTCTIGYGDGQRFVRIAPPQSPGVQAPLGWTLSRMSMDDLDRQRAEALEELPAVNLRDFLADGRIGCTA
jgi:hypothetical protein